jgi:hypothetical protein
VPLGEQSPHVLESAKEFGPGVPHTSKSANKYAAPVSVRLSSVRASSVPSGFITTPGTPEFSLCAPTRAK